MQSSSLLFRRFFVGKRLLARSSRLGGKSFDNLTLELEDSINSRNMESFLIIMPDCESIRFLKRIISGQQQAISGLQIQTLEELIGQIWDVGSNQHQKKKISISSQTLLVYRLFANIERIGLSNTQLQQGYREPDIKPPLARINQAVEKINWLKSNGWTPEALKQAVNQETIPRDLADLITVYQSYQRELGEHWIDEAGIHASVLEMLQEWSKGNVVDGNRSSFLPVEQTVDLVVFLGFHNFSPADLQIICGLAKYIDTAIYFDFCPENEELFAGVKKNYDYLIKNDFQLFQSVEKADTQVAHMQSYLSRYLFQPQKDKQKFNLRHRIHLKAVPNKVEEVELVAQLIKKHSKTVDLGRIGVSFCQLDDYLPLIEEIFPSYGITFRTCATKPILKFKLVQQALSKLKDSLDHSDLLTPSQFLKTALQIIDTKKFLPMLVSCNTQKISERTIHHEISAFRQFLNIIKEITLVNMTQIDKFDQSFLAQAHRPNEFYLNCLDIALQAGKIGLKTQGNGALVFPLACAGAIWFDIMILGGLAENDFPVSLSPNLFDLGQEVRDNQVDHLHEERLMFFNALSLPSQRLYLTYPTNDHPAELGRSSFIDHLENIVDISDLEMENDKPIFTVESFLRHYGMNQYHHDPKNGNHSQTSFLPSNQIDEQQLKLINHTVWVEKSRLETGTALEYQGQIGMDKVTERHFRKLKSRSYSVSQLEQYGRCPFQYFAHHVLNLAINQGDITENRYLPSLQKGNLLHKILFDFYSERKDSDWLDELRSEEDLRVAQLDLSKIAQKHLDLYSKEQQIKPDLFWEIETEEIVGSAHRTGLLEQFLKLDFEQKNLAVKPRYFEVAFGSIATQKGRDLELGQSEPLQLGPIKVTGKIDRIEIGDGFFVIADYKTGYYIPTISEILAGLSLQLPIYIRVAEQLLASQIKKPNKRWKGVAGVYYLLRSQGQIKLGCGDKNYLDQAYSVGRRTAQIIPNSRQPHLESLDQLVDIALQHAYRYAEKIEHGYFPLTSHDKGKICRFCNFKQICRVGTISETGNTEK